MKTYQEIKDMYEASKKSLEKYGEQDWVKSTKIKELLEGQVSVLGWVLDVEESEEQ